MSLPAATVRYLCGIGAGDAGLSDAELLGRFIDRRDGAAFALLVRRHGDMVYGVCRRLLPTDQDAEDAFQATFLVLAEKAGTVAPREAVGNWLYGVARRAALLARRSIARRGERMTELTDLPAPAPDPLAELRAALDVEVSRLTDVLRTVVVLCDLEGRTRKEAAAILGWPEGTVAGRLAQARRLLAKRLARHAPAVSVAAVLSAAAARAPAAVLALASPERRVVPTSVAALTRAVLANLAGGKVMKTVIAVLALGCAGLGMTLGARQDKGTSPTPNAPGNLVAAAEKPVKADPVVFWGEEVDGLQAGLSLVETKVQQAGDTTRLEVKLEVKIRNVGKTPVTITYGAPQESEPMVADATGKRVPVTMPAVLDIIVVPIEQVIEPGKFFTLFHPKIIVLADPEQPLPENIEVPTSRVRPGTYTISYRGIVDSHVKLVTGGLPFKVMDPERVAKADIEDDKVAWGKEVGGLRAGLALKNARAYRYGDPIKPEVRIRNVGKEKVTITYRLLEECPPVVTGPRDARMTVAMPPPLDYYAAPMYPVLNPGETIILYNPAVEVQPTDRLTAGGELRVDTPTAYVTPGKYTVGYGGMIQSHPALSTGPAEFKVVDPEKAPKADRADHTVAWGKEVNGLQGGLALKDDRPYRQGETVTLVVRVRNTGKEEVKFRYCRETYFEIPPTVTDGTGKPVPLERQHATGFAALVPVNLAPGNEIEVGERQLELKPALFGPGKYSVQYEQLETPENDKTLSKLATGKLELEVRETKEAQRPVAPEGKKEAEGLTAWGKEVNGLQAGLSIRSGGEHASETSTLVVRVRNVGKEAVKFSYLQPLVEHSFTVTGGDGKPVPQPKILSDIGERNAGVVELAPGKEMVLHEFNRRFLPAGKGGSDDAWKKPDALYHGTGKIGIRYDQVFGTPEMGAPGWELDPALGKLSTGTLELTVTDTGNVGERGDDSPTGIAERYFLAALTGRIDDAVALAVKGTSAARRERVEELAEQFRAIRRPTVHAAADEALVVSEVVKFAKPRPEGEGQVFLVFTVAKSGGVWLVRDIDATNLDGVIARVWKFKTGAQAVPPMPAEAPDAATGPRATVERYLAAALAGRVDEAVGLAVKGTSTRAPSDRKLVSEFRKRIVASEVRLWKVLAAWDAGEAVAVTEEFRWVEFRPAENENPNVAAPPRVEGQPEGTRVAYVSAFLAFKVVKSGGRWLVKDTDVTTEKDALDRVEAFKAKHPAATAVPARAADPKAGPDNKLVGTWRLVSAKYDGEAVTFPEGLTTVKHVTPTQFMWAGYGKDGKVVRAAGGTYTLKGDAYQETPAYGVGDDFDAIRGKVQAFEWKVEGDRWRHTGKLSNGISVDEVWERVPRGK